MSDNDLIRRGDALAAMREWTYCCDAEDAIAALPAVMAQRYALDHRKGEMVHDQVNGVWVFCGDLALGPQLAALEPMTQPAPDALAGVLSQVRAAEENLDEGYDETARLILQAILTEHGAAEEAERFSDSTTPAPTCLHLTAEMARDCPVCTPSPDFSDKTARAIDAAEDEPVVNDKLRTMHQEYLQAIADARLVTDAVSPTDARLRAAVAQLDAGDVKEAWEKAYWRMRSYAVHDDACKLNKPPRFDGPCSCGLTAALEEALALLTEKPHDRA